MSVIFRFPASTPPAPPASVDCYRNLNLLAHAQLEELEIGSRCGGHGVCGGDRVRVIIATGTGASKSTVLSGITDAEREHLSPDELRDGWRLACQCYPERDALAIELEIPSPGG